jgi:hypothetical protein
MDQAMAALLLCHVCRAAGLSIDRNALFVAKVHRQEVQMSTTPAQEAAVEAVARVAQANLPR